MLSPLRIAILTYNNKLFSDFQQLFEENNLHLYCVLEHVEILQPQHIRDIDLWLLDVEDAIFEAANTHHLFHLASFVLLYSGNYHHLVQSQGMPKAIFNQPFDEFQQNQFVIFIKNFIFNKKHAEGHQIVNQEILFNEQKLRSIINNTKDAIIMVNAFGIINFWNKAAEKMFEYTYGEAFGKNIDELLARFGNISNLMEKEYHKFSVSGKFRMLSKPIETILYNKSKKQIPVEISFTAVRINEEWNVLAVIRNLTDKYDIQKQLKRINYLMDVIIDNANVWISYTNENNKQIIWNKAAENITGYSRTEAFKAPEIWKKLIPDDTYRETFEREISLSANNENPPYSQLQVISKNGKKKNILYYRKNLMAEYNKPSGYISVAYDVTSENIKQQEVAARLKEKEVLIKEINHRVKNNLQVMNSLMNLQANVITQSAMKEIFRTTQNRIRAMAIIQETLYLSGNYTELNFTEFLKKYTHELNNIYGTAEFIKFEIHDIPLFVNINIAVSLGLLFNEIITNSLRHAFVERSKGSITIDVIKHVNAEIKYVIKDDGVGFPKHINWEQPESLGLQLIHILTNQIDGKCNVTSSAIGTCYNITFHV